MTSPVPDREVSQERDVCAAPVVVGGEPVTVHVYDVGEIGMVQAESSFKQK